MSVFSRARNGMMVALAAIALVGAGFVATPRTAAAQAASGPDWGAVAGVLNERAPVRSAISAYTVWQGTADDFLQEAPTFDENGIDRWTADFVPAAEIKLPVIDLSIFGDIGYRFVASGTEIQTGWTDATLGAKLNIVRNESLALGGWVSGTLPIGTEDTRIADYKAGKIGLGLSWAPLPWFFFNANAVTGYIFEVDDPYSNESLESIEFKFMGELGILIPGGLGSGRLGIEGFYRENSFDKSSFIVYAEGHIMFLFLRVATAFDVDSGVSGVANGFQNGELTIFAGVNFGLPEF